MNMGNVTFLMVLIFLVLLHLGKNDFAAHNVTHVNGTVAQSVRLSLCLNIDVNTSEIIWIFKAPGQVDLIIAKIINGSKRNVFTPEFLNRLEAYDNGTLQINCLHSNHSGNYTAIVIMNGNNQEEKLFILSVLDVTTTTAPTLISRYDCTTPFNITDSRSVYETIKGQKCLTSEAKLLNSVAGSILCTVETNSSHETLSIILQRICTTEEKETHQQSQRETTSKINNNEVKCIDLCLNGRLNNILNCSVTATLEVKYCWHEEKHTSTNDLIQCSVWDNMLKVIRQERNSKGSYTCIVADATMCNVVQFILQHSYREHTKPRETELICRVVATAVIFFLGILFFIWVWSRKEVKCNASDNSRHTLELEGEPEESSES